MLQASNKHDVVSQIHANPCARMLSFVFRAEEYLGVLRGYIIRIWLFSSVNDGLAAAVPSDYVFSSYSTLTTGSVGPRDVRRAVPSK